MCVSCPATKVPALSPRNAFPPVMLSLTAMRALSGNIANVGRCDWSSRLSAIGMMEFCGVKTYL